MKAKLNPPASESTDLKHLWKPGQSGNPAGRPLGTRNKLSQTYLEKLSDHFQQHAIEALDRALVESPVGYLGLIGKLLPKNLIAELALSGTALDLDSERRARIAEEWLLTRDNKND